MVLPPLRLPDVDPMTRCSGCGAMLPPSRDTPLEIPLFCLRCTKMRDRDRARRARALRCDRVKTRMVG